MAGPVDSGSFAASVRVGPAGRRSVPLIIVATGMLAPLELSQQSDASFPQQYLTPPLLFQLSTQGSSATPMMPSVSALVSNSILA